MVRPIQAFATILLDATVNGFFGAAHSGVPPMAGTRMSNCAAPSGRGVLFFSLKQKEDAVPSASPRTAQRRVSTTGPSQLQKASCNPFAWLCEWHKTRTRTSRWFDPVSIGLHPSQLVQEFVQPLCFWTLPCAIILQ